MLGGGGVLGFAWLVGALSALEVEADLAANDVDIVVGTSAGSVAAAALACGVSVGQMRRHHQGVPSPDDPAIHYDYVTGGSGRPPWPRLAVGSPRLLLGAVRHPRRIHPLLTVAAALPTGRGTLASVSEMIEGLAAASGEDGWPSRPRPWIVAADYSSGNRVVFGRDQPAGSGVSVRLAEAVVASCSIPAWYPPIVINERPYIDGGAISNASTDVLLGQGLDEVYVLAPMASLTTDHPRSPLTRIERSVRRVITRRILADVTALRAEGTRVVVVTPGPEDLEVMGANLMNPRRRIDVLDTAMRTSAVQFRAARFQRPARAARPRPAPLDAETATGREQSSRSSA